jgi:hypothetical protein
MPRMHNHSVNCVDPPLPPLGAIVMPSLWNSEEHRAPYASRRASERRARAYISTGRVSGGVVLVGREANANTGAAAIGLDVGLNWAVSFNEKDLRLAQKMQVGPCITVGTQL